MQRVTAVIAEELSKQYDVTIVSFEEPEQEDLSMYRLRAINYQAGNTKNS